ncbi:MAG TPA: hypothetical protein DCY07_02390 [Rhodospirillaceae bacterium]|nr:hypothetical protein [Rhodospirillaceae bacterium]
MQQTAYIKARQLKAARVLLDWSQEDLARTSGISIATIRRLEVGFISPRGKTMASVRRALEDAGLEFIDPDGVRRRPEDIVVYQGPDGLMAFLDDVYEFSRKKGGEIVTLYASEKPFLKVLNPSEDRVHIDRMTQIKSNISFKCILKETPTKLDCAAYCEYRHLSKHYVNSVPFYVYGDKFASILFDADPSPKIIVIRSSQMAEAYRQQFHSMWDKATPLTTERGKAAR